MSFLLDQLKKSGKKRQIELALLEQMKKSEHTQKTQSGPEDEKIPGNFSRRFKIHQKFFYLFLGICIISAGLFFWLKYNVLSEKQDNALQRASVEKPNQSSAKAIKTTNKPQDPATVKEPVPTALEEEPVKASFIEKKGEKTFNDTEAVNRLQEQNRKTAEEKTYAKAMSKVNNEPQNLQGVVDISELPESVKYSLPEIKISSHLYRKDSPLVSINGRIMTEGYNVTEELYLEEITPEGVILSYRNHRFSIKVK